MFRKLYLVYYTNGDNQTDCSHYWASTRANAIEHHKDDQGTINNIIDIYHETKALHKDDLEVSLARYITKPALNRTLIQYKGGDGIDH